VKRFLVILLVILILGGTIFFFGWVQLQIPAGTHAVIFTKTNGWEAQPLSPGTFVWRWQRLIPTNLSLYLFPAEPRRISLEATGTLPGGEVLSTLLEDSDAFSYRLSLTMAFSIRANSLPALAETESLRPDTIESWYDQIEARLAELATRTLVSVMQRSDTPSAAETLEQLSSEIRSAIESSFPEITVDSIAATQLTLPAVVLYQRAQELAEGVMEARAQALRAAADELAEQQTSDQNQLDRLERYGQILDQYPVLLEYFRVGREIGGDPLDIEALIDGPGE
jgi:hypothetical protein